MSLPLRSRRTSFPMISGDLSIALQVQAQVQAQVQQCGNSSDSCKEGDVRWREVSGKLIIVDAVSRR